MHFLILSWHDLVQPMGGLKRDVSPVNCGTKSLLQFLLSAKTASYVPQGGGAFCSKARGRCTRHLQQARAGHQHEQGRGQHYPTTQAIPTTGVRQPALWILLGNSQSGNFHFTETRKSPSISLETLMQLSGKRQRCFLLLQAALFLSPP